MGTLWVWRKLGLFLYNLLLLGWYFCCFIYFCIVFYFLWQCFIATSIWMKIIRVSFAVYMLTCNIIYCSHCHPVFLILSFLKRVLLWYTYIIWTIWMCGDNTIAVHARRHDWDRPLFHQNRPPVITTESKPFALVITDQVQQHLACFNEKMTTYIAEVRTFQQLK